MIRYVDVSQSLAEDGYNFAFWNTIISQFMEFDGEYAWETWAEFQVVYMGIEIERYRDHFLANNPTESTKPVPVGHLSVAAEQILIKLHDDSEYCAGYSYIGGKTPENIAAIKELKSHDMLLFYRGLMTEDGELCGSGWCRSREGNKYVEEFSL